MFEPPCACNIPTIELPSDQETAMNADQKKRYPYMRSPIKVGPMELRHRAVMSAHGMGLGDGSHGVSQKLHDYVLTRAKGGAALLGTESAPIHYTSQSRALQVQLFSDGVLPSLTKLATAVRDAGSKLSITLWHGGHNITFLEGQAAVAASPIPSITRETPRALGRSEIKEIVAAYGDATRRCRKAGLDAVEVQTATSYLLGSFLSPAMNHRTDEYGGSFENRTRIVREILEVVREAAGPDMAVGVRTSTSHHIPHAPVDYTLEESVASMRLLSDAGLVDWVSIISGSRWAGHETIPPMNTPRNQLAAEGKRFREEISVPVIVAGRIRSPGDAEALIAEGCADIVAMARTWIAEPEWMKKIEAGREDSIRPCMSCNQACAGFVFKGKPGSCILNPAAGREDELAPPAQTSNPKRIAVIGGGPAGMEAARVAAIRGHRVTLYEAQKILGGQMRLAAEAPHREEMLAPLFWWENELRRSQVEVRLGIEIKSPTDVEADEIIWAVGAEAAQTAVWRLRPWLKAGIPGADKLPHGRNILAGERKATGKVLVIDEEGGWSAISVAEMLAAKEEVAAVTVVTTERTWGEADLTFTRELQQLTQRVNDAGIEVICDAVVEEIAGATICLRDGRWIGPFDDIVLATGTAARQFPDRAKAVGDCVAPRGIWAATHDAARLARRI